MSYVPLGGPEETHIIFEREFPAHLDALDVTEQRNPLSKLHTLASSDAPPDQYVYEQIGTLDIVRFSDAGRLYTKVLTHVPDGNSSYHIVYVLYVDRTHQYDQGKLGKFSQQARQKLDTITDLSSVRRVESYLDEHDSLTADDLDELLDDG
ncbi:hypothetical protein [Halovivax gelatinilyticus]|uniref:hypothetical protein n=1 Tax=Halovivax gelatinilyticus TaxID=2961597 RepID=UPI0020CA451E|nr:hypothetical protein [Halovivax gelatinilyticus]